MDIHFVLPSCRLNEDNGIIQRCYPFGLEIMIKNKEFFSTNNTSAAEEDRLFRPEKTFAKIVYPPPKQKTKFFFQ